MSSELEDQLTIRALVENWVVWRDAGFWDRFRTVWHEDGVMQATWTQGTVDEFIAMSQAGFAKGVRIHHFLGGHSSDISGDRAIAQTKMTIIQRALVHDVEVDVACTGRFYDFIARRDDRWGIVFRQPIYEIDRMTVVDPGKQVELDSELLEQFPYGYRNLAYLQSLIGYDVKKDMPGLTGPEVDALYSRGQAWLDGADSPF
jgi:hypothetical protein